MNIRDHNYNQIIEHTKRAFHNFSKRVLAKQILKVLEKNKTKKQALASQSDIVIEQDQMPSQSFNDKKSYFEENESLPKGTVHTNKQTNIKQEQSITKISQLGYGDYVIIDVKISKENWRIYSNLDGLKMLNTKQVIPNVFYLRKSCFQILPPPICFEEKDKKITSNSMIALKNVFTGSYLHLTTDIAKSQQFGYELKLLPTLDKTGLFKLIQNQNSDLTITTDEQVQIASYYQPEIRISISQQTLEGKANRHLIASYSEFYFRLTKLQDASNIKSNPYFYIHCVQIDKNLEAEEPSLQKFTVKKQIREFQIDEGVSSEKSGPGKQNELGFWKCQLYELVAIRPSGTFQIRDSKSLNLCQIWQLEKVQEKQQGLHCRIRNVISNQQLSNQNKEGLQSLSNFKRNSVLQFKKQEKNQYMILNDQDINLAAIYDNETERYVLKYEQQFNLQNQLLMNKTYSYKFQLIQLQLYHSNILFQMLEVQDVLKSNYMLLLKWGFFFEDRLDKVKYSLSNLKKNLRLMRKKIEEINSALDKFNQVLKKEENNLIHIQNIGKQLKLLQILILYCQVIKIKIGKPSQNQQQIYKFAANQLKPTLSRLFNLILLMTFHNKACSQVIIEHNLIFNELLKDYSQQIGCIIEEAIKNLCILTNKISEEEDVIFLWTTHIQRITVPQLFYIQKQYIDIISEVIVDPDDIGIHPYQYKIKEQLIGNRKKKILPKFGLSSQKTLGTPEPLIIFEYDSFPIDAQIKQPNPRAFTTTFQLRHLFQNRKSILKYKDQIGYISSMLRLMRNLCKDRNKKLAKIMEDYGLTVEFMHSIFKNKQISWEIVTKFLDLYCAMYIVQDPFLCFQKRQVKCYSWQKISNFDFNLKTGILFNQFTQQFIAQEKHRVFDMYILPIFDRFFEDFQKSQEGAIDHSKIESFYNIISIIYQITNYGYLNQRLIQRYIKYMLQFQDIVLRKQPKNQKKEKIILKIVQLFALAQQIWTTIQAMNLLLIIYKNLKASNITSNEYLIDIFTKALNYDQSILHQKASTRKRKISFNLKSSARTTQQRASQKIVIDHHDLDLQIIEFTLKKLVENRFAINNKSLKSLLNFLEVISNRGERICEFLTEIFILDNAEAEKLYIQYSGISPLQSNQSNTTRRLLIVMKVKQLVDKITEQNVENQDQTRKKQKILQLKSLLMKIMKNLDAFKTSNHQLFNVCQTMLKKLKIHTVLIQVMKFYDKQSYQSLINDMVVFFIEFIRGNEQNLIAMASYFPLFTKKYSYERLPQFLTALFSKNQNKQECFWMIYRNIDKKMDDSHKQILFESIYNVLKIFPPSLLDNVKGQVIYNLLTNSKFQDYIKGTNQSPSFISIICLVGKGSAKIPQRIRQIISKTQLLQSLKSKQRNFILKSMHLKLYHFLYIENAAQIDEVECEQLIERIFLPQLRRLTPTCHSRAIMKIQELKSSANKPNKNENSDQIDYIVSEYSSLMMEGSEAVHISEEEQYFLFLLNIENQDQLSLLTCLKQILLKFCVINIQPLAYYIFKIINFMEKIFVKEEKVYQSRILNKLYQISTVIQEKYNRTHKRQSNYEFEVAYTKVQIFFKKFASIIQQENISYFKILKCAKVRYGDLQEFRNDQKKEKMVMQSEFLRFMNDLVEIMNNKSHFIELTSEGIIKEFFILYSQQNTHKLNIIKFLSKLMEVLEFQRDTNLKIFWAQLKRVDEFKQVKSDQKPESELVNCEVLKTQLSHLVDVFSFHLKDFMLNSIKSKLEFLFQRAESQTRLQFLSLSNHNLLEIHTKNRQFSIMNLIIFYFLSNVSFQKFFESLQVKAWQNYLEFSANQIQVKPNPYKIRIFIQIYESIKQKQGILNVFSRLLQPFLKKAFSLVYPQKWKEKIHIFVFFREFYNLLYKLIKNQLLSFEQLAKIEVSITQKFIQIFKNYCDQPNIYWGSQCHMILTTILSSFKNYNHLANIISKSNLFISNFQLVLTTKLNNGLASTNTQCQEMMAIMNDIIRLIKKISLKPFQGQVCKIMMKWPFKTMMLSFRENYTFIFDEKYKNPVQCERRYICSQEFCNFNKLTQYDRRILEAIANVLLLIDFGSKNMPKKGLLKDIEPDNKQFILLYNENLQGKNNCSSQSSNSEKYCNLIRTIDIKIEEQHQKVIFLIPYNEKLQKSQLQQEIQQQLKSANKQNYFQNIYHLSWYVQSQYESLKIIDKNYFSKHLVSNYQYLQWFFIIYLLIICWLKIFTKASIPKPLIYTINTITIFFKLILIAIEAKKIHDHRNLSKDIKYNKNINIRRYLHLLLSLMGIISYFGQYISQQYYAITFLLQILNLKFVQKLVMMLLQAIRSLFLILLFFQSIILTCTFMIFQSKYDKEQISVIDTYVRLGKEIILLQFIPIIVGDASNYLLLREIPYFLPMITFTIIFLQAFILAFLVIKLVTYAKQIKQKHYKCGVCGHSKEYLESVGKKYQNHIKYEHNVWNYIDFFIYIRRKVHKQVEQNILYELIQKHDFRFLRER